MQETPVSEAGTELLVKQEARPEPPVVPSDTERCSRRHVGRPMERLEDAAILTGHGRYGDDIAVKPGTLHAAVLRSPHAHAEILGIDVSGALAQKGVHAVLTGDDVREWSRPFVVGVKSPMEHWSLAIDRVRYSGEPVAVVVAESRALAEDGIEYIKVEYKPLPPVTSIEAAIADDAPVLHPKVGTNVVSDRHFRYGDPEAAFAKAAHRVTLETHYPRNTCTPIECAVVVAEFLAGNEGYEVTSNFMGPFSLHAVMAMALKLPANRLRHKAPRDSGGSFGVKQSVFPYVVLMCLASRKAGAPVKWVEDRLEHLSAATSATARLTKLEAAVERDGRITALSYDQIEDCGGYLRAPEPATFYRMHGCLTGAYAIPNLLVRNRVALTTKTPTGLVRGFGGPQVYFALERLMQRISVELKLDIVEVYRRNFIRADAFPYRTPSGALYDSGNYQEALRRALSDGGYDELVARRDAARSEGRLYGIGFASIIEPSVSNMGYISTVLPAEARRKAGPKNGAIASATVSVDLLGGVVVTVASTPAGQGHMTVCAQVVADVLGLDPADIVVNVEFDTHKDAWSVASGNYSSRFAGAVAGTVHLAAMRVKNKLARIVAAQFGCAPEQITFESGRIVPMGDEEKAVPFTRAASNAPHWAPALLPEGEEPGLRETVFWTPPNLEPPDDQDRINTSACYGFAFDMCGVEIDRVTGRIRIDRYVTAHDAGTLLNPALADGQIRGAFAQGLGASLLEEFRYGADGSFQSGTLADYLMPTTCEVPDPLILHLETPSPFTPLGAKGLGEGNNMSTPPCIGNAVADALGVEDVRLPLTPAKVLAFIGIDDPEPSRPEYREAAPKKKPAGGGKALTAQGTVELEATPEAVFAVLMDPVALAKVVPGCNALETTGPNQYRADVTVGVGMIKARFEARIGLSDIEAPRKLRLAGAGISPLGTAKGEGLVELTPTAKGTSLSYDYEAQVSGKVAAVGARMLDGAAKVVLTQLFESLGRQAAGKPVGGGGGSWLHKLLGRFRRKA
jgi:2-furoyl-CoA dehydrogenase large subunit